MRIFLRSLYLVLALLCCSSRAQASNLSVLAASMTPGTWASFPTSGLSATYFVYPGFPASIVTAYQGGVNWDSVGHTVNWLGGGHQSPPLHMVFDEATNTWGYLAEPPAAPPVVYWAHSYYHNAIDSTRRFSYHMKGPSENQFWRYDLTNNTWLQRASFFNGGAPTRAIVYFPEMDRVILHDPTLGRVSAYQETTDTWTTITTANNVCSGGNGYYHNFALYNPVQQIVLFGGGNNSAGTFSHKWCKMDAAGVITPMPDSPAGISLRIAESSNPTQGAMLVVDPATGDLLALANTGVFYRFIFQLNTWTVIDDAATRPALFATATNAISGTASTAVTSYGVILVVRHNGASTAAYLYKHSVFTPPDPIPNPVTCCGVTIHNTSGSTITNRPVTVGRPFKQGDINNCAHAQVGTTTPLTTQCNVLNRWPDGSIKFAVLSFVVPTIASASSVAINFYNDTVCNDTGGLSQAQMLDAAYNFDGAIEMTGASAQTVNARTMLSTGAWRYWLQGPIMTSVIIEDRTTARSYDKDFGDGSKALHPIFEARFYPTGNKVELGYTVENMWASHTQLNSMRDLTYSFVLKSGNTSPTTEDTTPSFNHIGSSRWRKSYWLGTDPPAIRIDYGTAYLMNTGIFPKMDSSLVMAESLLASQYSTWLAADRTIDGDSNSMGSYPKALGNAGEAPHIGLLNTYDVIYMLSWDDRMKEIVYGNADLAGRIPMHFREADTLAGYGDYFDATGTSNQPPSSGSVETFGKVVSINARRTVTLSDLPQVGSVTPNDQILTGTITTDNWGISPNHYPTVGYLPYYLTGAYYYLEEIQQWAAWGIAYKLGGYDTAGSTNNFVRQGERGYFHQTNVRGDGWVFKNVLWAASTSPDGSPEKAYFEDKMKNNIAEWEGIDNVPISDATRQIHWDWGRGTRAFNPVVLGAVNRLPSPLGLWRNGGTAALDPAHLDLSVVELGNAPWEENFVLVSFGMARQLGYNTINLLQYMARPRINLALNPAARVGNPPTVPLGPYTFDAYRWPTTMIASHTWAQSWTEFVTGFAQTSVPTSVRNGFRSTLGSDHNYAFISLAALSFLTDFTADGYNGSDAYTYAKSVIPFQDRFQTESPKWAILPFTNLATPEPPSSLSGRVGGGSFSGGGKLQ